MSAPQTSIDFLFLNTRPEFTDFVAPILAELEHRGFRCQIATLEELDHYQSVLGNPAASAQDIEAAWPVANPAVLLMTNESKAVERFPNSAKVLMGHSIFIRDTIPTPVQQGAYFFLGYDYYFCPSVFYLEWTMRAVMDSFFFPSATSHPTTRPRTLIPGGYTKAFRQPEGTKSKLAVRTETTRILYVPSVYSPEHSGHIFHSHGFGILGALTASHPNAQVTCRPHPTDQDRDYVALMANAFAHNERVKFDFDRVPAAHLYHAFDVLVTDMSGFAFAYALATGKRPIFYIEELEASRHPRFMAVARRFGRVAANETELVQLVQAQIRHPDCLTKPEHEGLAESLFNDLNNPIQAADDLIAVLNGQSRPHWVPLALAAAA